jgi:Wntless-like, transmembrane domain
LALSLSESVPTEFVAFSFRFGFRFRKVEEEKKINFQRKMVKEVMRVDVMTKQESLILLVIGVGVLVACVIVGSTGPSATLSHHEWTYQCASKSHVNFTQPECTGVNLGGDNPVGAPWSYVLDVSHMNAYWALSAFPYNVAGKLNNEEVDGSSLPTNVTVYWRASTHSNARWNVQETRVVNHHLTCHKGATMCDGWWLADQFYLKHVSYRFDVEFLPSVARERYIADVRFHVELGNDQFNNMRLGFHVTWLIVAVGVLIALLFKMRRRAFSQWTFEQRWAAWLLAALCLYNDPFFALNFMVDTWAFAFFGALFEAILQCSLALFWLFHLDRYRAASVKRGDAPPSKVPRWVEMCKYVLALAYGIFSVVLYTMVRVKERAQPVPGDSLSGGVVALFYLTALSFSALLVWVVVLAVVTLPVVMPRKHHVRRFVYFFVPTSVVILSTLVGLFASSTGPYNRGLLGFMYFFGLNNTYVLLLTYGYMPYSGGFSTPNARLIDDDDVDDLESNVARRNSDDDDDDDSDDSEGNESRALLAPATLFRQERSDVDPLHIVDDDGDGVATSAAAAAAVVRQPRTTVSSAAAQPRYGAVDSPFATQSRSDLQDEGL